jgi:hypothetical protein
MKRVTCGKPKPRLTIYVSVNRMATTCPTPNPAVDADLQCVAAPCQLPLRWTGHTRVDQATASDIARIEELLGPGELLPALLERHTWVQRQCAHGAQRAPFDI